MADGMAARPGAPALVQGGVVGADGAEAGGALQFITLLIVGMAVALLVMVTVEAIMETV